MKFMDWGCLHDTTSWKIYDRLSCNHPEVSTVASEEPATRDQDYIAPSIIISWLLKDSATLYNSTATCCWSENIMGLSLSLIYCTLSVITLYIRISNYQLIIILIELQYKLSDKRDYQILSLNKYWSLEWTTRST